MKSKNTLLATAISTLVASNAMAGADFTMDDGTKFTFGGYVKMDVRHVSGECSYQDYWAGNNPCSASNDVSATNLNARESRFNMSVTRGEWAGFIELDFYGQGGNQFISNSANPRLRHALIKNKNWLLGQTWSTYMPLHALAETLQFGGAMNAQVFIRQPQIRYTNGSFTAAIETAETIGDGDIGNSTSNLGITGSNQDPDESAVDVVFRYDFKGDWGVVSLGTLVRQVDQGDDAASADDTAIAYNVAGKFNIGAKDDVKFEVNMGEFGRYAGVTLMSDVVDPGTGQRVVREGLTVKVSGRHHWNDSWRSTAYFGMGKVDEDGTAPELERSIWGVNLLKQVSPKLTVGGEIGQYIVDDANLSDSLSSEYFQFSAKLAF